ncbi:MAG: ATP-binding protein [Hyphomonadaceae bacterium]
MNAFKLLSGQSIARQMVALIIVALLVAMAINIVIVASLPPPPRLVTRLDQVIPRLEALVQEIARTPEKGYAAAATRASDRAIRFALSERPPAQANDPISQAVTRRLAERLAMPAANIRAAATTRDFVRIVAEDAEPLSARAIDGFPIFGSTQIAVRAGRFWITASAPRRPEDRAWLRYVGLWFIGSTLLLTPLALLFAQRLAAPIGKFADGAERLGRDPESPLLTEAGPRELRAAVRAFNTMQERLRRFVAGRTLMLAAISHDLRTPLQRLRFRIDALPDDTRRALLADIEEMEAMVASTLAFAREDADRAPREPLDLGALVSSVCDDAVDAGGKAQCDAEGRIVVNGDPMRLKRAIANLVSNAVKYAGAADVRVRRQGGAAVVEVEDRGPGIPEERIEEMFQPFRRLEPSRSRATGGAGLGLAIARTIARAHGGDVTLAPRPGGGLTARLALPA